MHAARNIFTPGATPSKFWAAGSRPEWGRSRRDGSMFAELLAACMQRSKQPGMQSEEIPITKRRTPKCQS